MFSGHFSIQWIGRLWRDVDEFAACIGETATSTQDHQKPTSGWRLSCDFIGNFLSDHMTVRPAATDVIHFRPEWKFQISIEQLLGH